MENMWIMVVLVFVGSFIKPSMTQTGSIGNFNTSVDVTKYPGEDCTRPCNGRARVCYYNWILEHYHAMGPACRQCARGNLQDCVKDQCITGDGSVRGVMSINRQIPGPTFHVCRNDLIVVDVTNLMGGTSSTIHWHGFHQRETPFMDGVPYITQCPIGFGTTFRYSFIATESGTQWYHSHTGHHKTNGHFGGFIVRDLKSRDPHNSLYDEDKPEHLIIASDWMEDLAEMFDPGLPTHPIGLRPTNVLINGRGVLLNANRTATTRVPIEVFRVKKGRRFRFRLVNSGSHVCPIMLEIEGHKLTVIASDSYPINRVDVDTIYTTSGERYDFVLNANQPADKENYWVRVRAVGVCARFQIEQYAILSYAKTGSSLSLSVPRVFPQYNDDFKRKALLNNAQTVCGNTNDEEYCISDLAAPVDRPDITKKPYDEKYFLRFVNIPQNVDTLFQKGNYQHFFATATILNVGTINNISFTSPAISLLTQRDEIDENMFCDQFTKPARCDNSQICNCIHRLKIKLNSIVELIIVDESPVVSVVNHPFHLHGTQMFVMGMGTSLDGTPMTVEKARQMDDNNQLNWITHNPPVKDTVSVPSKGYTIVRFRADNPGFWFMHCHFEWHMAAGMALVLQVGETTDMKNPPANFPKCNNYKPDVDRAFLSVNRISLL